MSDTNPSHTQQRQRPRREMASMETIRCRLSELRQIISASDIQQLSNMAVEWGGADVIISAIRDERIDRFLSSQPIVISPQKSLPMRRAVVTRHAKPLSWLFFELRDLFRGRLNHISKFDFYGALAQAALDYLAEHPEPDTCQDFLLAVVDAADWFCDELENSSLTQKPLRNKRII